MSAPPNDPYAAWRSRDYRLYAVTWFLLIVGKQLESVALGWFVAKRTGDPLQLGLLGLTQATPMMLFAIVGGQLADRFDRQRVLGAALAVGALASLGLAAATAMGAPLPVIYGLLFLSALAMSLGQPSRAALLPQIIAPAIFANAAAWSSSIFQTAGMIGPVLGGAVLLVSTPAAFVLGAAGRLTGAVLVQRLEPRPQERSSEALTWESLVAGVRYVFRCKPILGSISLDMLAVLFGGFTYLLPIFAMDVLTWRGQPAGEMGLGLLRSAEAVGALGMAVVLAHRPPIARAGRTLLVVVGLFGLTIVAFGLSRNLLFSLLLMITLGAIDNVSVVIRHTLVQMLTPDAMRGRVSAVNGVFIVASNDLGGLESGAAAWLLGHAALAAGLASADEARVTGAVASVVLGGFCTLAVAAGAALLFPQLRRIGSLADLRPEPEAPTRGPDAPDRRLP